MFVVLLCFSLLVIPCCSLKVFLRAFSKIANNRNTEREVWFCTSYYKAFYCFYSGKANVEVIGMSVLRPDSKKKINAGHILRVALLLAAKTL